MCSHTTVYAGKQGRVTVLQYFDQCAATQECHAADTRHDTPPRHGIQTQGRPALCYPFDVERHTGIDSYPFYNVLGETRPGNPSPTFHTPERTLNSMPIAIASHIF